MSEERQLCGCGGYVPCGRNPAYCAVTGRQNEVRALRASDNARWQKYLASAAEKQRQQNAKYAAERREHLRRAQVQSLKPKPEDYVEVFSKREREYREQVRKAWQGGNLGSQMTMHAGRLPSLEQYERAPISRAARYYWKSRDPHDAWRKQQQRAYA